MYIIHMIQYTLLLEKNQLKDLKEISTETLTVSRMIRDAIDAYLKINKPKTTATVSPSAGGDSNE